MNLGSTSGKQYWCEFYRARTNPQIHLAYESRLEKAWYFVMIRKSNRLLNIFKPFQHYWIAHGAVVTGLVQLMPKGSLIGDEAFTLRVTITIMPYQYAFVDYGQMYVHPQTIKYNIKHQTFTQTLPITQLIHVHEASVSTKNLYYQSVGPWGWTGDLRLSTKKSQMFVR